ncbi:MAG: leucine-rich repeat domain-containing protein [Paludibacteraceae bacterium]|nr:leucine-rich repeat domain-containing protein [Paludibacteraceae bacterium]
MKTINSLRSKLLALTLALVFTPTLWAERFEYNQIYYNTLNDSTAEVTYQTEWSSPSYNHTSVIIPSIVEYNGKVYSIVRIDEAAFYECTSLTSLSIPKTVTNIGASAFYGCTSLSKVLITASVQTIGSAAFANCTSLEEITCLAAIPPTRSNPLVDGDVFDGVDVANILLYVPMESIELYRNADQWKDFQIRVYYGSEECHEYMHVNLTALPLITGKLTYRLSTDDGSEIPYVDSVWILNTDKEPLRKFYAQSGDTIDLLFLERGTYILNVYLNECRKSRTFVHRPKYKSQWCDTWNVMWFDGWRFEETASTSKYRLGKDTVIGDYIYSKFIPGTFVRFTDDRKVYVYHEGFDDHDPYTEDLPTGEYLAYDFSAQVGDTLEVFSGVGTYSTYSCVVYDVETAPSPCVVDDVQADLKTFPLIIKLHPLCDVDGEGNMEISSEEITWIEGVGSPEGFLISYLPCGWAGGGTFALLCAYKGDELKYTGSLYDEYGCEYNANDPHLPLVDWCNQWNILAHGYLGPREPLYGAKTTIYQLGEDTIINHLRYKQLTRYASDDVNQTKTYVGAIRFTKNNRQVYFYYDNAEYLLYDFKAQVGDTLEVFAGIDNYKYHKTYKHVVTNKEPIEDEQTKVTLEVIVTEEFEGNIYEEKFTTTWMEGVGSPDGIVHNHATQFAGSIITDLLCAYVDDRRMYRTNTKDPFGIDYTQLGCVYNEGDFIEDAFPMLSGLQRTVYDEFCGEAEIGAVYTGKQTFDKIFFENDKPYILCNDYLLREEDNKILIYSQLLNKDLVLYDFTLEVGDSLPALYIDYHARNAMDWMPYNPDVVDYNIDFDGTIYPADTFVVTDISNVTLLDGKEYKKWTFDNGMEYVEGIGMYGGRRNGDFFGLIQEVVVPCHIGTHLVCVSKNNKLLYQMDAAEMERLGAECLCDYTPTIKDNAKNGKIGGRPTPTQWYVLDIETKDMGDPRPTVLRAETFSYTLENDSIVVNGRTFYQLACQSTKDTATTKSVVGALHFSEDKGNRVYFLRDGVEYLLYDFTAEPGDTIEIFAGINNYPQETTYTHVVADKDTTEDGACRMFLEVVFPEETTTVENAEKVWLAGLGSIDGIVHNTAKRASVARSSGTQTSIMLCAWREDDCLYTTNHPDYQTLGCVYNIDETTAVDDIHTSPSYQKLLRDGQLLIIHEGKTYNVMGVAIE